LGLVGPKASTGLDFTGWTPQRASRPATLPGYPFGVSAIEQSRHLATEIPGPASLDLSRRRAAAVSASVGKTVPVFAARAAGGIVEDVDGNRLIDLGSGIAVTTVGNAAPEVVRRVQEQVAAFTHTCFMITPYDGYVDVAAALAELTPGDHAKKSALFNSGAEAVENAVKIARHATGRQAVVVFDHAYHGRTNLTMALTSKVMPYKKGFGPFAPEVYRIPFPYCYRCEAGGRTDGQCCMAGRERLEQIFASTVDPDSVAAIIMELELGEGGFVPAPTEYVDELAGFARDHGILFIADEIQTGFGRTGTLFASEHYGLVPDIIMKVENSDVKGSSDVKVENSDVKVGNLDVKVLLSRVLLVASAVKQEKLKVNFEMLNEATNNARPTSMKIVLKEMPEKNKEILIKDIYKVIMEVIIQEKLDIPRLISYVHGLSSRTVRPKILDVQGKSR